MKRIVVSTFVALVLFAVAPAAAAGPSFAVEVLPLGNLDKPMIVPDYFVKAGNLSAYGFVEYSGSWFTNHVLCWTPNEHVGARVELGMDDGGGSFVKIGPRFTFASTSLGTLQVAPLYVSGTPAFNRELLLFWKSEDFLPTSGRLWTEGFIRTLRNDGHSYGQPQLWYNPSGSGKYRWLTNLDYGIEIEVGGADRTVRGGIRKRF